MPMNPMTPKPPPVPAAFKLLSELNEFLDHSRDERHAVLSDYGAATEQRETALDNIKQAVAAAGADRADAKRALTEASVEVQETVKEAKAAATHVVKTANEEAAESHKAIERAKQDAKSVNENWDKRIRRREDDVAGREFACKERENNAFKDREDAVVLRETALAEAEKIVKREGTAVQALKVTYEALIEEIEALQRRAPR